MGGTRDALQVLRRLSRSIVGRHRNERMISGRMEKGREGRCEEQVCQLTPAFTQSPA